MNGCLVDKDIFTTIIGDNESESFLRIEPLDGTSSNAIRKAADSVGSAETRDSVGSVETSN